MLSTTGRLRGSGAGARRLHDLLADADQSENQPQRGLQRAPPDRDEHQAAKCAAITHAIAQDKEAEFRPRPYWGR